MKLKILLASAASFLLTSPALAIGPNCPADYAAQARGLIAQQVKEGLFTGTVLIAKDGVPLLREGFGAANREWDIPNAPDTKFRLGSVTK